MRDGVIGRLSFAPDQNLHTKINLKKSCLLQKKAYFGLIVMLKGYSFDLQNISQAQSLLCTGNDGGWQRG